MTIESIKVLDDGFVRYIDHMGNDRAISEAARKSYGNEGKERTKEQERNLIRLLMRKKHTSPFEMAELKFHVRVPMDCWRQWIRHRTANVNEYSTRYTEAIDSIQKTPPDKWRKQSKDSKQGSSGFLPAGPEHPEEQHDSIGRGLSIREENLHNACKEVYRDRLAFGVAKEQARKDLPLSTYTEAYWKIDLHNLFHFLKLRLSPDAQYEIRQYAKAIHSIVKVLFPIANKAFEDYSLNAVTFSAQEMHLIKIILKDYQQRTGTQFLPTGYIIGNPMTDREIKEFKAKLEFK